MKQEWIDYLGEIGAEAPILERIEQIESSLAALCPQPFEDLFVGTSVREDGTYAFGSLWFFSADYLAEVHEFVANGSDQFDYTLLSASASWIQVFKEAYDFTTPTDASRLRVVARSGADFLNEFEAARLNCTHLRRLLRERLIPNMRSPLVGEGPSL